jgi:hypothetical protein
MEGTYIDLKDYPSNRARYATISYLRAQNHKA